MTHRESTRSLKAKVVRLLGGRNILVWEPDTKERHRLAEMFRALEIDSVMFPATLAECTRVLQIQKQRWALLMVSYVAPDLVGIGFCRRLRERECFQNLPILLTAQNCSSQDVTLACEVGVDAFLVKPYSPNALMKRISGLLQGCQTPAVHVAELRAAENFIRNGEAAAARKLIESVLLECADHPRALHALAGVMAIETRHLEAIELLKKLLERNPRSIAAWKSLLSLYEKEGQLDLVAETARTMQKLSPANPSHLLHLACARLRQNAFAEADIVFEHVHAMLIKAASLPHHGPSEGLTLTKDDLALIAQMADLEMELGRPAEAIEKLRLNLVFDSENPKVLYGLGFAYEHSGDVALAAHYYKLALGICPGYEEPQWGLQRMEQSVESTEKGRQAPSGRQGNSLKRAA